MGGFLKPPLSVPLPEKKTSPPLVRQAVLARCGVSPGHPSAGEGASHASGRRRHHLPEAHGWPSSRRFTAVAAGAVTEAPAAHASSDTSTSGDGAGGDAGPRKLPAFDYTALVGAVCEIHSLALPTKVEVAVQADAYTLVLGLRGLEGKLALHVSWHPDAARVCLGPPPPRVHKTEQLSFGEECAANLRGLILVAVALPEPWERVATFSFAERPGAPPAFFLHCEIMARNSNAVLVAAGAKSTIVSCAYQVGAAQTSVRPMSPGFPYSPPPPAPGINPDPAMSAAEWRRTVAAATAMVAEARNAPSTKKYKNENAKRKAEERAARAGPPGIEKGMVRAFRGVSPALAAALALGAGVVPSAAPDDVNDAAWACLHNEWQAWVASSITAAAVVAAGSEETSAAAALSRAGWCASLGQMLLHAPGGGSGGSGAASPSPRSSASAAAASAGEAQSTGEERDAGAVASATAAGAPVTVRAAVTAAGAIYEPLSAASAAADPSAAGGPVGALFAAVYGGASDADVFRRERERLLQGVRGALKKNALKARHP